MCLMIALHILCNLLIVIWFVGVFIFLVILKFCNYFGINKCFKKYWNILMCYMFPDYSKFS